VNFRRRCRWSSCSWRSSRPSLWRRLFGAFTCCLTPAATCRR
jgi:hypothetical protein